MWVAARYRLPPFIRLKPRPAGVPYEAAALASMSGQHTLMATVLGQMLNDYLINPSQIPWDRADEVRGSSPRFGLRCAQSASASPAGAVAGTAV
jgi:hypothetical protein